MALGVAFFIGGMAGVTLLAVPLAWAFSRRAARRHGLTDRTRLARLEEAVAALVAERNQVEDLAVRLDFTEQLLAERHGAAGGAAPSAGAVGHAPKVGKLWRPPPYDA